MSITMKIFIVTLSRKLVLIKHILFGILIGISVIVPGLSGGTTALMLGIYSDIIDFADNLLIDFKKSFKFFTPLIAGAVIGIGFISFPLRFILDRFSLEFSFFVIGIILGSISLFTNSIFKSPIKNFLCISAGIIICFLLDSFYENSYVYNDSTIVLLLIGLLSAIALILPGISLSYILIAFDYYEKIILAITNLDILFLLKFGASILLSTVLIIKILNKLYKKYPISINMLILGMVIGSIRQVFIRFPSSNELLVCILVFSLGIIVSFTLSFVKE